jgi:transcriptional regulator with XRE-family HTH domain
VSRKQHLSAGQRVRRWRELKGLTTRDLADRSGVHKSTINRIENDQQDARESELRSMTDAMGITMVQFYDEAS